jgi:cell division protein FtsN
VDLDSDRWIQKYRKGSSNMNRIKQLMKSRQAKIASIVVVIVAVLAASYFFPSASDKTSNTHGKAGKESFISDIESDIKDLSRNGEAAQSTEEGDLRNREDSADSNTKDSKKIAETKSKKQEHEITVKSSKEETDRNKAETSEKRSTAGKNRSPKGKKEKPVPIPQKDKYQTDPVPSTRPKPIEPGNTHINQDRKYSCQFSIRCDTILNNMDLFNYDKISVLPKDGTIFAAMKVEFSEGESVFDLLNRVAKDNKIPLEFEFTPMYNSAHIEGIHNLYEFDCGPLSGWNYKVNGWVPNYGCSRYQLKDGDVVEWLYSCDLGKDIGSDYTVDN